MTAASAPGWETGPLPGVLRRRVPVHGDDRGWLLEVWRASWTDPLAGGPMHQANVSRSRPGVLRGLHCHRRQADAWVVVEGHAFVALVDLRAASRGEGEPVTATLESGAGDVLYLPALVAHGFYAHDEVALAYHATNEHDGSDELGFAWDDPIAAVPWPTRRPILSARDRGAPSLASLLEALRAGAT
jgi:dTDP-4-dehydrorhamnose 3,5-epimerase